MEKTNKVIPTIYYEVEGKEWRKEQLPPDTMKSVICDLILFAQCHQVTRLKLEAKRYSPFRSGPKIDWYEYIDGKFHKTK